MSKVLSKEGILLSGNKFFKKLKYIMTFLIDYFEGLRKDADKKTFFPPAPAPYFFKSTSHMKIKKRRIISMLPLINKRK